MEISKEQIRHLYVDQGLTHRQCATALGVSYGSVSWLFKKHKIKAQRPSGFQHGNKVNKGRNPEKCTGWKGGKQSVLCDSCGETIFKFPCLIKDKNFCNQKCYGNWKSKNFKGNGNPNYGNTVMFGDSNPNWKGGISLEPYCDSWKDNDFKIWIKERDNHSCQNPDCYGNSKNLVVHHIDYNKKNCHPDNLITLCISCNARANFNRKTWSSKFHKIIEIKGE